MNEAVKLTTADRTAMRAELRADARLMTYLRALKRISGAGSARRVVIASSYTVRTLDPYLRIEAELAGWRLDPHYVEYAQWQQALIVGAGSTEPDAYLLMLHPDSLLADETELTAAIELAAASVADVLGSFRARSKAPLFVLHLPPPRLNEADCLGADAIRRNDAAIQLSHRIAHLAKNLDGAYVIDLSAAPELADSWRDDRGLQANLSPIASHAAPRLAEAIARMIAPLFRPRRKVLMLDLDNTLWGGIVGELGSAGVAIGENWPGAGYIAFQRMVRELSQTGVLLALNSKNNEADARSVFETRPEMVLRWNDFVSCRVNWHDKAENLASIAAELSLGLDSIVFVDDSPVECARVRAAFPEVEVVQLPEDPAALVDALRACPGFDVLNLTEEDRLRTRGYQAESERTVLRASAGDYRSFLRSLSLQIDIAPCDDRSFERLHQLLLKTNQFHLTLERPTLIELASRRGGLYSIQLRDRFGDYGIIGVLEMVARRDTIEIMNLALSCRALGRLVEETVLAFAAELAQARGAVALTAKPVSGPRNQPATEFFAKAGFSSLGDQGIGLPLGPGKPPYPLEAVVKRPEPAVLEHS